MDALIRTPDGAPRTTIDKYIGRITTIDCILDFETLLEDYLIEEKE